MKGSMIFQTWAWKDNSCGTYKNGADICSGSVSWCHHQPEDGSILGGKRSLCTWRWRRWLKKSGWIWKLLYLKGLLICSLKSNFYLDFCPFTTYTSAVSSFKYTLIVNCLPYHKILYIFWMYSMGFVCVKKFYFICTHVVNHELLKFKAECECEKIWKKLSQVLVKFNSDMRRTLI